MKDTQMATSSPTQANTLGIFISRDLVKPMVLANFTDDASLTNMITMPGYTDTVHGHPHSVLPSSDLSDYYPMLWVDNAAYENEHPFNLRASWLARYAIAGDAVLYHMSRSDTGGAESISAQDFSFYNRMIEVKMAQFLDLRWNDAARHVQERWAEGFDPSRYFVSSRAF